MASSWSTAPQSCCCYTHNLARGDVRTDLLVKGVHGQQASLCLFGVFLGGAGAGEGLAIQAGEVGLAAQEARHEEVKEGPQLQDIVLDGGSCQDEAVLSHQSFACLQACHGLSFPLLLESKCSVSCSFSA